MTELSSRQCHAVLWSVIPLSLLLGLDGTAVTVALSEIQKDFLLSYQALQWVVISYLVMVGSCSILAGRFGDVFGIKKTLSVGIFLVAIGCLLSTFSNGIWSMAGGRIVQGLGSAAVAGLGISVFTKFLPPDWKAKAFGRWISLGSLGIVIGPFLGGYCMHFASWRAIFAVLAAWSLAQLILLQILLPKDKPEVRNESLGMKEGVMQALGIGLFIIWLSQGSHWGWASIQSLAAVLGAACFLMSFFLVERKKKKPVIDLSLFKNSNFLGGNIAAFCAGAAIFSLIVFLGLYYTQALKIPSGKLGLFYLPFCLGLFLSSVYGGSIFHAVRPKTLCMGGLVLLICATLGLSIAIEQRAPFWYMAVGLAGYGVGLGLFFNVVGSMIIHATPASKAGVGGGIFASIRFMGGCIGLPLFTLAFDFLGYRNFISRLVGNEIAVPHLSLKKLNLIFAGALHDGQLKELFPATPLSHVHALVKSSFSHAYGETLALFASVFLFSLVVIAISIKENGPETE